MRKKYLTPFLFVLLITTVACGGFNKAELDLLAKSRMTWDEKSTESSGNYVYSTSFESWVGFGSETTIFVTNDVVTGRNYSSYDADRMPSDSYEEDENAIGTNSFGASAKTIDALYDECEEILKTKNPVRFYITFQLFSDNLLKSCEYSDKNCADDCADGVRIDAISFTN